MNRSLIFYVTTLGLFAAIIASVIHYGPASHSTVAAAGDAGLLQGFADGLKTPLAQILTQLLVIVIAARAMGALFTRIAQPAVIGEMAVGIALGPSLLGAAFPGVQHYLFPPSSLGPLSMLSQVGILLFMFVVGMELDMGLVRRKANAAVLISHVSIVFPFVLGLVSALWLYRDYGGTKSFAPFALFMGISMSITAFPVLARIIQERGLAGTELGNTAITCAAVDDITAWTGLAFIVALSRAQNLFGSALTIVFAAAFFLVVTCVVRPLLTKMVANLPDPANPGKNETVITLVIVFACALATEAIGIHALFGAFLAGIAMPTNEQFRGFLRDRLEYFSTLFLLPIFFAFTGLRTQIGLLSSGTDWAVCGILLLIAIVGKFGGSTLASRISGMSWRDSAAIGALMNTRGLVELIALNLGLDLGVLSPKIFAMLVLMALITTFATGPVISKLGLGYMATQRSGKEPGEAATLTG